RRVLFRSIRARGTGRRPIAPMTPMPAARAGGGDEQEGRAGESLHRSRGSRAHIAVERGAERGGGPRMDERQPQAPSPLRLLGLGTCSTLVRMKRWLVAVARLLAPAAGAGFCVGRYSRAGGGVARNGLPRPARTRPDI